MVQSDLEIIMEALKCEQERIESRGPTFIPNLRGVALHIKRLKARRDAISTSLRRAQRESDNLLQDPNT